ncbi:MAG: TIGR03619 family F420-dependent LLM class oxidoreductase [Actinobacteria bacterium]|nr:TIGR03619 family F420-dependent LLM class oxidoreductase [Actinomycetota bacterium]
MQFWQSGMFLPPARLTDLARASEAAGFEGVTVSDHIAYPETLSSPYPYTPDGRPPFERETPWPDPWIAIGAMAAVTSRLRFGTHIYIAPARPLLAVAKQVATAAVLSDDRVVLGAGAGWMREEFDLMGQPFERRGARFDEMLAVLARLWTGDVVEHRGEFYDFDPLSISPVPSKPVPVWIGGDSDAAIARAVRNDGWVGNLYQPDEAFEKAERVVKALREVGREPGPDFELVLSVYALDDLDLFRRLEDAGVTALITAPWMLAGSEWQDQADAIARFGDEVIGAMGQGPSGPLSGEQA